MSVCYRIKCGFEARFGYNSQFVNAYRVLHCDKGILLDRMGSKRDKDGWLNMDAVREDGESISAQYTAEWL